MHDDHTKTIAEYSFTGAELAALIARDADVRTLDEWASTAGRRYETRRRFNNTAQWACYLDVEHGPYIAPFFGATPDEARAKAAAWVRERETRLDDGTRHQFGHAAEV